MPELELAREKCVVCKPGTPSLAANEIAALQLEIDPAWAVVEARRLHRRWRFHDFASAFEFTSQLAQISEGQGHHPDIKLGWGYVEVDLETHAAHGLTRNDFVMAARFDGIA